MNKFKVSGVISSRISVQLNVQCALKYLRQGSALICKGQNDHLFDISRLEDETIRRSRKTGNQIFTDVVSYLRRTEASIAPPSKFNKPQIQKMLSY